MNEENPKTTLDSGKVQGPEPSPSKPTLENAPDAASAIGRKKRKYTKRKPKPEQEQEQKTPLVDPAVVERSVKTIVASVDGVVCKRLYDSVCYISADKKYAEQLAMQAHIQEGELQVVGELSGQVCQQYGILGQHAPAFMLGGVMLGWMTRVWLVTREITALRHAAIEAGLLTKEGRRREQDRKADAE